MATSQRCSVCNKELGPMHCTGCDGYFCWKDFKTHREGMFTEMDKIIEERSRLQDVINNGIPSHAHDSSLIEQIDKWQKSTIEKVKLVAAQARQQAIELLNTKQVKINTEFKSFSQELAHLKESENYVEHDLTRLNQMISQFKQDLRQSTQPTTIVLHTEQCDGIHWESLIYVEGKQVSTKNRQQATVVENPQVSAPSVQRKLECGGQACPNCGKCRDWYYHRGDYQRRDGATCGYLARDLAALGDALGDALRAHVCNCR